LVVKLIDNDVKNAEILKEGIPGFGANAKTLNRDI
jgi:hypothetical protein